VSLQGVRAICSESKEEAMKDAVSQGVQLDVSQECNQYLCSVLSSVTRIPPFTFVKKDGYSFLNIKSDANSEVDQIMHLKDRNIWIIPLEDKRIQIIIVPLSSIPKDKMKG
jgi:hypothetical protein